jgi:hypothetical protein
MRTRREKVEGPAIRAMVGPCHYNSHVKSGGKALRRISFKLSFLFKMLVLIHLSTVWIFEMPGRAKKAASSGFLFHSVFCVSELQFDVAHLVLFSLCSIAACACVSVYVSVCICVSVGLSHREIKTTPPPTSFPRRSDTAPPHLFESQENTESPLYKIREGVHYHS